MELKLKYPPTPEYAADLAATCVDAAKNVSGIDLDYTPRSLALVDQQLDRFARDGQDSSKIASTLFCFGCYVGEVLVRNVGGRWAAVTDSAMERLAGFPMVVMMENGDWWNPIGKVFKRLDDGVSESLEYFFTVAAGSGANSESS